MSKQLSSRDFLKAAEENVKASSALLDKSFTTRGMYLAGYVTECSLKAMIMFLTHPDDQAETFERISGSASMHYAETLTGILKVEYGVVLPSDLVRRHRRMKWNTGLRYETERADMGEARGVLKTGKLTLEWVEGIVS